jgi:hypothetical protein
MKQIINGKQYDTDKADLVASDRYWDGSNWERNGRNTYLYRTKRGNYFAHYTTCWQGERNSIAALTIEEAKDLFENLPEQEMTFEEAFGVAPEEA